MSEDGPIDLTQPSGPVLVVGGAGYIGSHCVALLQRRGIEVAVFDDLSTGHREAITAPLVVGFVDREAIAAVFTETHAR